MLEPIYRYFGIDPKTGDVVRRNSLQGYTTYSADAEDHIRVITNIEKELEKKTREVERLQERHANRVEKFEAHMRHIGYTVSFCYDAESILETEKDFTEMDEVIYKDQLASLKG